MTDARASHANHPSDDPVDDRRRRLERAGLRDPVAPLARGPGGAFVAIEMAVLIFVSALAMVAIVATADDGVADADRADAHATTAAVATARSTAPTADR